MYRTAAVTSFLRDGVRPVSEMNDRGMVPAIVMDEAIQARLVSWCSLLLQEGHYPARLAAVGCEAEPFWAAEACVVCKPRIK